jgi:hypothetical protein
MSTKMKMIRSRSTKTFKFKNVGGEITSGFGAPSCKTNHFQESFKETKDLAIATRIQQHLALSISPMFFFIQDSHIQHLLLK